MDLSTLPNKPIQANDLFKKPDDVQGEVNYIDKNTTDEKEKAKFKALEKLYYS